MREVINKFQKKHIDSLKKNSFVKTKVLVNIVMICYPKKECLDNFINL